MSNYRGPGRYRHYKGGRYKILGLALQEDTVRKPDDPIWSAGVAGDHMYFNQEKQFVIYRPLTPGSLLEKREEDFWARRLDDFNAMVELEHGTVPRFVRQPSRMERVIDLIGRILRSWSLKKRRRGAKV